jgi:hypothetical protein
MVIAPLSLGGQGQSWCNPGRPKYFPSGDSRTLDILLQPWMRSNSCSKMGVKTVSATHHGALWYLGLHESMLEEPTSVGSVPDFHLRGLTGPAEPRPGIGGLKNGTCPHGAKWLFEMVRCRGGRGRGTSKLARRPRTLRASVIGPANLVEVLETGFEMTPTTVEQHGQEAGATATARVRRRPELGIG